MLMQERVGKHMMTAQKGNVFVWLKCKRKKPPVVFWGESLSPALKHCLVAKFLESSKTMFYPTESSAPWDVCMCNIRCRQSAQEHLSQQLHARLLFLGKPKETIKCVSECWLLFDAEKYSAGKRHTFSRICIWAHPMLLYTTWNVKQPSYNILWEMQFSFK